MKVFLYQKTIKSNTNTFFFVIQQYLIHVQALVYCIESCYFAITWGLHFLENACEQQNQDDASVVLQRNLFKFMNVCTELVRNSKVIEIQEAVNCCIDI